MSARHSILVVDDDTAHRTMLRTLVGGWGYEISEADDGEAAIRLVRERAYDLVLMDVRMLKVSGLEALAAVKAINPAIPVVIMTAFSSVETAVAALKQGAHDYLTKPLDFDELRVTLERSMEHTRLKAENRAPARRAGGTLRAQPHRRPQPGHAAAAGHGRPGGAVGGHRADQRRMRDRQGGDRRCAPRQQRAAAKARSSASTARRSPSR